MWSKRESSLERVWLPRFARESHASVSRLEKPTSGCFAVYQTAWKSLKNINKSFFSCQKNYFHPVLEKRLLRGLQFYWPVRRSVKFMPCVILRMGEFFFTLRELFFATDLVFFFFNWEHIFSFLRNCVQTSYNYLSQITEETTSEIIVAELAFCIV